MGGYLDQHCGQATRVAGNIIGQYTRSRHSQNAMGRDGVIVADRARGKAEHGVVSASSSDVLIRVVGHNGYLTAGTAGYYIATTSAIHQNREPFNEYQIVAGARACNDLTRGQKRP